VLRASGTFAWPVQILNNKTDLSTQDKIQSQVFCTEARALTTEVELSLFLFNGTHYTSPIPVLICSDLNYFPLKPQGNDVVECSWYIDEFWRCATIGNQWDSYYRHGALDSCEGNMSNIYTCFKAKAKREEADARRIMATEIKVKRVSSTPVWSLKEKPSWD
jgi:hypothetical protein